MNSNDAHAALLLCLRILSVGIFVQSLELWTTKDLWLDRGSYSGVIPARIFSAVLWGRVALSLLIATSVVEPWDTALFAALLVFNFLFYLKFRGGLTGGSDSMLNLILTAGFFAQAFGLNKGAVYFIAIQSLVSYWIGGAIKVKEKEWRAGTALAEFLTMTIYEPEAWMSKWSQNRRQMWAISWATIVLEMTLPVLIFSTPSMLLPLFALGAIFHGFNAYWFGINRFIFSWLATYPCIAFLVHNLS